ncbi:unnamed protein product [Bathycoccus prasinos]
MVSMREAIERVVRTSEEIFSDIRRLELDDDDENDDDDDDENDDDALTTTTTKRKRRTHFKVPIEKSVGRVSERDVRAKRAHPVKDVSIMDGFCFNITNENNNTEKKFPGE